MSLVSFHCIISQFVSVLAGSFWQLWITFIGGWPNSGNNKCLLVSLTICFWPIPFENLWGDRWWHKTSVTVYHCSWRTAHHDRMWWVTTLLHCYSTVELSAYHCCSCGTPTHDGVCSRWRGDVKIVSSLLQLVHANHMYPQRAKETQQTDSPKHKR